jgi:hypothetical protein
MSLSLAVAASLLLSLSTPGLSQQTQGSSPKDADSQKNASPAQKQGEVVKIGVTLVQVDVTVVDSKGRPVTDLKAEDFEVFQNSRPQQVTNCSCVVAQPEETTSAKPQLLTHLRLYRDGKLVYDGEPRPFDPQSQTDLKQLVAGGSLRLGSNLTPGDYALQVIAVDRLAKEKDRMATGWIDFEIVPAK